MYIAREVIIDLFPEAQTKLLFQFTNRHLHCELRVISALYDLAADHGHDLDHVYDVDSIWPGFSTVTEVRSVVTKWRQLSAN